jgi:hypothetical protein
MGSEREPTLARGEGRDGPLRAGGALRRRSRSSWANQPRGEGREEASRAWTPTELARDGQEEETWQTDGEERDRGGESASKSRVGTRISSPPSIIPS